MPGGSRRQEAAVLHQVTARLIVAHTETTGERLDQEVRRAAQQGEVVAQALTMEDEVVTYNCDMDLGSYIKHTVFNFDAHRRIEHYGLITRQAGVVTPPDL